MASVSLTSWPFILHIVVELPATIAFMLYPSATLPMPQVHAHAVIRQYALLLLSTNIMAAVFVFQSRNDESGDDGVGHIERCIAGSLALYHIGPLIRAWCRVWNAQGRGKRLLGGPWVHTVVHLLCSMVLAGHSLDWWKQSKAM